MLSVIFLAHRILYLFGPGFKMSKKTEKTKTVKVCNLDVLWRDAERVGGFYMGKNEA